MTATQRIWHVTHVTITHQVTGRASFMQFTLQYRCISFSAPGSPAGSADQASPEHVCSGYCLTAYCHTHLSHRSDSCSCSRRQLRFLSDTYCSCVIFSYVSFCINTVASSELSPQTQSPCHQSSRPPSLLIALLIPETALLIVAHGVHVSLRHLRHPCPTSLISEGSFQLPLYLVVQSLYRAVTTMSARGLGWLCTLDTSVQPCPNNWFCLLYDLCRLFSHFANASWLLQCVTVLFKCFALCDCLLCSNLLSSAV
jgi:hypothetical protein